MDRIRSWVGIILATHPSSLVQDRARCQCSQELMQPIKRAPRRGCGWGEGGWYYNYWSAALSEHFSIITSLRSCLLLFLAQRFCPLLLRGGAQAATLDFWSRFQESPGDWSEGLEEAHKAQTIVRLPLKRLTKVNSAFLPWTCHSAHLAFFQSWHSYYRAAFLTEDQHTWFCWLRISFTQCWTALQCIWVWALHTLKTTVSSLRLLLFLQRSACSLISLLECTRLLHWEKAGLKSGCIILPRALSSTTWGRMKKWQICMNGTDSRIARVWSPTINNITVGKARPEWSKNRIHIMGWLTIWWKESILKL